MLARASLGEEGGKRVVLGFGCVQGRQGAVGLQRENHRKILELTSTHLQPMLHAVELPASIAHLDPSLANMH